MTTPQAMVGVLAIQGDVDAHIGALTELGVDTTRVLSEEDINASMVW